MARKKPAPNRTTRVTTITVPPELIEAAKRLEINVSQTATEALRKEIRMREAVQTETKELEPMIQRLRKERSSSIDRARESGASAAKKWFPHAKYDVLKWFEEQDWNDITRSDETWFYRINREQPDLVDGGDPVGADADPYWDAFATTALELWARIQREVESD